MCIDHITTGWTERDGGWAGYVLKILMIVIEMRLLIAKWHGCGVCVSVYCSLRVTGNRRSRALLSVGMQNVVS